jgi:TRAP-type mannitol/chloroaromatic compound transport system permease small subunit
VPPFSSRLQTTCGAKASARSAAALQHHHRRRPAWRLPASSGCRNTGRLVAGPGRRDQKQRIGAEILGEVAILQALIAFVRAADACTATVGRIVQWFSIGTVLVCATVVVLRYGFRIGFVWMQELYVWIHAAVFILGAGYVLMRDGHVRVDIFYARWRPKTKAAVELVSSVVFLLPWLALLGWTTWPFMVLSWQAGEPSDQLGGMPALYVLKICLMLFVVFMGIAMLAVMARCVLVLLGRTEFLHRKRDEAAAPQSGPGPL